MKFTLTVILIFASLGSISSQVCSYWQSIGRPDRTFLVPLAPYLDARVTRAGSCDKLYVSWDEGYLGLTGIVDAVLTFPRGRFDLLKYGGCDNTGPLDVASAISTGNKKPPLTIRKSGKNLYPTLPLQITYTDLVDKAGDNYLVLLWTRARGSDFYNLLAGLNISNCVSVDMAVIPPRCTGGYSGVEAFPECSIGTRTINSAYSVDSYFEFHDADDKLIDPTSHDYTSWVTTSPRLGATSLRADLKSTGQKISVFADILDELIPIEEILPLSYYTRRTCTTCPGTTAANQWYVNIYVTNATSAKDIVWGSNNCNSYAWIPSTTPTKDVWVKNEVTLASTEVGWQRAPCGGGSAVNTDMDIGTFISNHAGWKVWRVMISIGDRASTNVNYQGDIDEIYFHGRTYDIEKDVGPLTTETTTCTSSFGNYESSGADTPLIGTIGQNSTFAYRSYMKFPLQGLKGGIIRTAVLYLYNPPGGNLAVNKNVSINIYDYPEGTSVTGQGVTGYTDLGTGVKYGCFTASGVSQGWVKINLLKSAITHIQNLINNGDPYLTMGGSFLAPGGIIFYSKSEVVHPPRITFTWA